MLLRKTFFLFLILSLLIPAGVAAQTSGAPVVHAILFYSPTCPHCHIVMDEVLPPLQTNYGDQLQVLEIDVSQPAGQQLYQTFLIEYQIPDNRRGVPALVAGETVMVGSLEIPEMFPGIIEANLEDGLAWPSLTGLESFLEEGELSTEAAAGQPAGLWLAWLGMLALFGALVFAAWRVGSNPNLRVMLPEGNARWLIPALSLVGLLISIYLTIVELGQTEAVCGPVGDCNAVQSSSYATIAGIPVALLGIIFYVVVAGVWLALPRLSADQDRPVGWGLTAVAFFGVLFSIYLTAVEIFILQAVCAWCVTSALLSAAIFVLVVLALFPHPAAVREEKRKARRHVAH